MTLKFISNRAKALSKGANLSGECSKGVCADLNEDINLVKTKREQGYLRQQLLHGFKLIKIDLRGLSFPGAPYISCMALALPLGLSPFLPPIVYECCWLPL